MRKHGIFHRLGIIYSIKRKGRLLQKAFLCICAHSDIEYKSIKNETMMTILMKQEIEFLQKLSTVLEEYNAIISYNEHGKIEIELYLSGPGSDAPLGVPISLPKSFDETDINELFEKLEEDVEIISLERAAGTYKGLHFGPAKQQI